MALLKIAVVVMAEGCCGISVTVVITIVAVAL
jgi:hypothetical protein